MNHKRMKRTHVRLELHWNLTTHFQWSAIEFILVFIVNVSINWCRKLHWFVSACHYQTNPLALFILNVWDLLHLLFLENSLLTFLIHIIINRMRSIRKWNQRNHFGYGTWRFEWCNTSIKIFTTHHTIAGWTQVYI